MAIARITDIRGLVSLDNGISQEILKNKDVISEHGGLLTISEFANIVFDDGRVVEVTGPVSFNLDSSFFNEVTFEDSITQISDFASLDYINNDLEENIIEPQIEDSTLEQNNATIDIQSEQLDTQLNTQNTELVEENNSEFTQTQSTITFEDNIENEDEPVVDNDNQAPIANAEVNELNEDTIINGQIDFFDPDGTATVAVNGNIPTGLTLNPDGTYEFDASSYDSLAEGEIQNIEVPLTVTDNNGATTETTLTINIVGTNDAAIVSSATANLIETDTALTTSGTLTSTDVDNADNTFIANTIVGSKGTFTIDENGNWDFTANSAFNELNTGSTLSETFTVSSIDGTESTVTVNISGTNDAMTGFEMNEVNNFTEDSTSAGDTVTTVKTAPSDEDGGDITYSISDTTNYAINETTGEVTLTEAGANLVNSGQELPAFNVTATSAGVDGSSQTVQNLDPAVTTVNDETVVVEDNATTSEDIAINIDVLANDTDEEGNISPVVSVTQGSNGTVTINEDGTVKYTPNEDFNGTDSFTYTNEEGNTETVNVIVDPTNDNPIAVDDGNIASVTYTVNVDNVLNTDAFTVKAYNSEGVEGELALRKDSSPEGFGVAGDDASNGASSEIGGEEYIAIEFKDDIQSVDVSFAWMASSENAEIGFYKDGVLIDTQYKMGGTDRVDGPYSYETSDGQAFDEIRFAGYGTNSDFLLHEITVNTVDSTFETNEDTAITIDVLDNDTDVEGDELSIIQIQGQDVSAGQTVNISENGEVIGTAKVVNGQIVFTPGENLQNLSDGENQNVTFDYTVSDGSLTDTANVTVNVTGITDNFVPTSEDESQSIKFESLNEIDTTSTNLIITLDTSGSMSMENYGGVVTLDDGSTTTRFEIAKNSLIDTIEAYKEQGSIDVNLTLFGSSGANIGWMSSDEAITYLESLSMNQNGDLLKDGNDYNVSGNGTDYYEAITTTDNIDFSGHPADKNVGIFISDGDPTENWWMVNSEYDSAIQNWKSFIDNNNIDLSVYGIGENVSSSYLDIIQVTDGKIASIITNEADMSDTLVAEAISKSVSGNILDNVSGGDGDISIVKITIDGVDYTASDMPITTPDGATLNVDFSSGNYTYSAKANLFTEDTTETFIVTASDEDGDETNFNVHINIDAADSQNYIQSDYDYWADNENIDGTVNSDYINIGTGNNKTINAGDGDDIVDTPIQVGNNLGTGHIIDGGEGNDKLIIDDVLDSGSYKYEITANGDGTFDIEKIGYNDYSQWSLNHYAVTVDSIEAIEFTDKTFVLNDSGDAFVESTDSSADDLLVATLVDGIVEGAYYETSSGVTGYTDENGNFNFREGDSVTFSVGGVVLGTATAEDIASGQTFLQDIADVDRTDLNDEYLENMAVFLQSIDTADSGDNIVITQAMRDALADVTIDLTTATEEEVKSLIESIGGNYVGEDAAMVHVQEMLQEYAGIDESEFDERISDDTLSATLGNEPQAGIEFTTSSGVSGITDDNGSFFYNVGDEITFTKDGEVLSTIDSNAIGDDSLITFNELESLNQTEIDFENLELDFDSLSEITDSEDTTVYEKDESLEDKEIIMEDMLTSEDSDSSLSTLLGETEEDRNITSLDELKTEETTAQDDGNDEYCPFKALEESSGNLISNIEADDTTDIDDHNS